MRKGLIIFTMLFIAGVAAVNTGCEEEPLEACEQDLFCDGTVEVTACCTDGQDCYYTYNGVDYPDTNEGITNLIEALDCTTAKKASMEDDAYAYTFARLKTMLEEARIRSKQ